MRKIVYTVLLFLAVLSIGFSWTLIKTRFPLLTYNPSVEHGGSEIADYDSSSIVLSPNDGFLKFFDQTGDSGKISHSADTMFFQFARKYIFDGKVNFPNDSIVLFSHNPNIVVEDSNSVKASLMLTAIDSVSYTQSSYKFVKSLPTTAVVWALDVKIKEVFNGSVATNLYYTTNLLPFSPTSVSIINDVVWNSCSLVEKTMGGHTGIQMKYTCLGGDATTGKAIVYVRYTLF